jgi:hypothetical protein
MYTENTNKSVFETISRAILSSGNNRVLTFHADVNTDRDTTVNLFVDEKEFKKIFKDIQINEFPNLKIYKKIKMVALDASISPDKRKKILSDFDKTPDDNIFVISSCETIGEGIDTKNANMCVFVDPKSSYVKIIQNIGRIVRKIFGKDKPKSTVLIPCWVDKAKYLDCNGDRDKCDEVIRQDMGESGNFNGILNVLSALRQEDEDLYDICLHYPDTFSPQEIKENLEKQGFEVGDIVGDGTLIETIEHIADMQIDTEMLDVCDTDEDIIMNIAKDNDVCIEVHTNSLENPVEVYNADCGSDKVVRLFKNEHDENDTPVYQPIVSKDGIKCGKKSETISKPNKNKRTNIKVHTNPDVKVLWSIADGFDLTKDICSCILDCEVIKYDPMIIAIEIVERSKQRELNGQNLIPKYLCRYKNKSYSKEELQEHKDARKLGEWRLALKCIGTSKCYHKVKQYLDNHLCGWCGIEDLEELSLINAREIVERAKHREKEGKNLLPRRCCQNKTMRENNKYPEKELQEHRSIH